MFFAEDLETASRNILRVSAHPSFAAAFTVTMSEKSTSDWSASCLKPEDRSGLALPKGEGNRTPKFQIPSPES